MRIENYKTIMIGHVMSKFYAATLDTPISREAECQGFKEAHMLTFE